jgi:AcrR family transcriptional regulator
MGQAAVGGGGAGKGRKKPARGRARRPHRVQQRTLDTRERLVEAALHVFAANGFEGAKTRDIARRAGVALAALPYHFETKEALWRAAADRIFGLLARRFAGWLETPEADARAHLEHLLREFVRFAAEHPELHRFMLQEGTGGSARLAWLVDTHVRPFFRRICGEVGDAQERGWIPAGRPVHFFYALIGAVSMPYAVAPEFRLLTGSDPASERLVEEHVAFLRALFFP